MLDLFRKTDDKRYPMANYPRLDYVKLNIHSILYIIKMYYKTSRAYVKRPNMLVSLLGNLNIDLTKEPEELYEELKNTSIYAASDHKIINGVSLEHEFNSDTIIYNTKELFVYKDSNFDFTDEDYENRIPIKCIYSTKSDIFLTHPKKYPNGVYESDLFIYTIDIPLLAMQYYFWAKDMLKNEMDIDPARFIYEIVLTNTIDSIFEINIINRYMSMVNNEFVEPYVNFNVFTLKDISKYIDKMLLWYKKDLSKKHDLYFTQILKTLKTGLDKDFLDTLKIDEIYLSKRTKWVWILSRIKIVNFLFKNYKSKKEKAYENDVITDLKYMDRNKNLITNNEEIDNMLETAVNELKLNLFI